jgi:hypothetical protein
MFGKSGYSGKISGLSGLSAHPDTPGKSPDSLGFQHTSERTEFTQIFNLA